MPDKTPALPPENMPAELAAIEKKIRGRPPGSITKDGTRIPPAWGDLPESAPWSEEIQWVHENRFHCITWRQNGMPKINFYAASPAPSKGALALMQDAATNPKAFLALLNKAKTGGDDGNSDAERGEKRSIAEVRKVLAKYAA